MELCPRESASTATQPSKTTYWCPLYNVSSRIRNTLNGNWFRKSSLFLCQKYKFACVPEISTTEEASFVWMQIIANCDNESRRVCAITCAATVCFGGNPEPCNKIPKNAHTKTWHIQGVSVSRRLIEHPNEAKYCRALDLWHCRALRGLRRLFVASRPWQASYICAICLMHLLERG